MKMSLAFRWAYVVGIIAIIFGLAGAIVPLLAIVDPGIHPKLLTGTLETAPAIVAFLSHGYLVWAGVGILRGRKPLFLAYFFAIETAYALCLFLSLPALVVSGLVEAEEARWSSTVSSGFVLQLISGFPLWAWLLTRRVSSTITSRGSKHCCPDRSQIG
jgi:hypothetical protein